MTQEPLSSLSIITLTYKDPKGLKSTLESIQALKNHFSDFENIIVDSSPELNEEVLKDFKKQNWPIIHVVTPPKGVFNAMNIALGQFTKDYVWFLNGGDRLASIDCLVRIFKKLSQDPSIDYFYAGANMYKNGKYLYPLQPSPVFIRNLLGFNHICHQAVLYKRTKLLEVGPFESRFWIAADYDHHYRFYLAQSKFACLQEILVDYDMSGQSMDPKPAFVDFKLIQKEHSKKLPLWVNTCNPILSFYHEKRVRLLKTLSHSKIKPILHPIWLLWNRLKNK